MTDRTEFIQRELLPLLGEFAGDFDIEGICDDVSEFDPVDGYVWRAGMDDIDAMNEILAAHDKTA